MNLQKVCLKKRQTWIKNTLFEILSFLSRETFVFFGAASSIISSSLSIMFGLDNFLLGNFEAFGFDSWLAGTSSFFTSLITKSQNV